ncbi:MAG TPA: TaqI-like C-terminal specificity domain-containing protein [Kofleriaceae bacterium]|nr:TaqI-like C-terminal specificity domain-containing protein [Kofleriaceae bacterium]
MTTIALGTAPAEAYVSSIGPEHRRRKGTVYTPTPLARFVLDLAGLVSGAIRGPVLDPAVGGGVFLADVLRRVALEIGAGALPLTGRRQRQALLQFARRNLFGIDVDERARELALQGLTALVQRLAPGPVEPGFLHENLIIDDFLLGDRVGHLAASVGGFAYVVGNPPYVATQRLEAAHKPLLRTLFSTAVGRVDLYTLFIERGFQVLREGGTLAYITPDKWLTSETSRPLRGLLARRGAVRQVARFQSHEVFRDAAVVPCVTVLQRVEGDACDDVRVLACTADPTGAVQVTHESRVPGRELDDRPWQLQPRDLLALVERVRAGHSSLATLSRRISAGPATGRDEVYVRPAAELDVEEALLRPAIRGRDIAAFSIADSGLRVLLPFEFRDEGPRLITLARYPRARRYLERHRDILERRHCVRVWEKAWFDLHDLPATDITRAVKIVVPDVAEHCRFAVDRAASFPLHSAYYIMLLDERLADYTTAVLNSTVIEFCIRLLAPVAKDGFSRFRRQFLAALPIATTTNGERARIADAAARGDRGELDARVTRLYGLAETDLDLMRAYLAARVRGDHR